MAESKKGDGAPPKSAPGDEGERPPFMQQLLDNPFLLLFLGVASPALLYLVWGIIEVANIPIGK